MAKRSTPERDFQDALVEHARKKGWMVAHFGSANVRAGKYITPTAYDGSGFPDLCMMRYERVVFAELKRKGVRKLGPEQEKWRAVIHRTTAEWYLWNPLDWPDIEEVLR